MIGGLKKTTSRIAVATAFAAMTATGAYAADLGGNCCSDLEERVAELEATTARKGNRKVSLEVSGHVHEGLFIWDDGEDSGAYIATVNYSRTRFRFKGSAKITSDWSAGFLIEIGLRQTGNSSGFEQTENNDGSLDIRHQALYVKSKRLGTFWMGHTSMAVDGISDICLGCPISSTHESNLAYASFDTRNVAGNSFGPNWGALGAGNMVASNGARRQLIRYISPEVSGFVFSADWGADEDFQSENNWTAALRYANEFNGVRVAGGIGYHEVEDDLSTTDLYGWGASLSLQHVASGFFIAGSYGEQTDDNITAGRDTTNGWSVIAGVGRKLSPLGTTTVWVRYGEYEGRSFDANNGGVNDSYGNSEVLSLGVNQKIDPAAMEVYVSYYHVTGELVDFNGLGIAPGPGTFDVEDFNMVMFGARIKF